MGIEVHCDRIAALKAAPTLAVVSASIGSTGQTCQRAACGLPAAAALLLRCDLPLRSDTGALAKEERLSETRMYKTSRPFYYQNHKKEPRVRRLRRSI